MKYLNKFANTTAYNTAKAGQDFGYPHVSLISESGSLIYDGEAPIPLPYVEIGGVKWAKCNVGTSHPYESGLFYQWGDVQGYSASQVGSEKNFSDSDYIYYSSGVGYTKYNQDDEKTVLELTDDAVYVASNGEQRIPSFSDFESLYNAADYSYVSNYQGSGIAGGLMTSKTDSSKVLFFPAAGFPWDGEMMNTAFGYYWCNDLAEEEENNANCIMMSNSGMYVGGYQTYRYKGANIRGIYID